MWSFHYKPLWSETDAIPVTDVDAALDTVEEEMNNTNHMTLHINGCRVFSSVNAVHPYKEAYKSTRA